MSPDRGGAAPRDPPSVEAPSPLAETMYGRTPPPRFDLPKAGVALGVAWSGVEGAGDHIVSARIELAGRASVLAEVTRPFVDGFRRKEVRERFPAWLRDEQKRAGRAPVVGFDAPLSLAETHLRQLGLLRQAIRGPAALGRKLEERFLAGDLDFNTASDAFREAAGREKPRLTDAYRAIPLLPLGPRLFRRTFFALVTLSRVDASFLPWDRPAAGKPTFLEVNPTHAARKLIGSPGYADDTREGVRRSSDRAGILRTLRHATGLRFELEQAAYVIEDGTGEALDAVLAAVAAASAQEYGFVGVPYNVPRSEGWIYSVPEEPWRLAHDAK